MLLTFAALAAAAASAQSAAAADEPVLEVTRVPDVVRSGGDELLEVRVTVRGGRAGRRVLLTFQPPELAPGRPEPLGSPLTEKDVFVEGHPDVSIHRAYAGSTADACVQGAAPPTHGAFATLPPGSATTIRLRYRVGKVPLRADLRVRVEALASDGASAVARSPAVRVRGRRLPRLTLKTSPVLAERPFARRPRLAIRGWASPHLRGRVVTVGYVEAPFGLGFVELARKGYRRIGRARVGSDGAFRVGTWRPPQRGTMYRLVARTAATRRLFGQQSCPLHFGVA